MSAAVTAGRLAVEGREVELREEINTALKKMRAYARDMEVRTICPTVIAWGSACVCVCTPRCC